MKNAVLGSTEMDRIADALIRVREILTNGGFELAPTGHSVSQAIATDFSDGKLRLGLLWGSQSRSPVGLLTPFGSIHIDAAQHVGPQGVNRVVNIITQEFSAKLTTSIIHRPYQEVAQLMVLQRDADGNALAQIEGAKVVDGFIEPCNGHSATAGILDKENTLFSSKHGLLVPIAEVLEDVVAAAAPQDRGTMALTDALRRRVKRNGLAWNVARPSFEATVK